MPSYVARPHVLTDEFVPGYLGGSFGLFPFVHGDPLANQFDGPFLVRLIRKEVTGLCGAFIPFMGWSVNVSLFSSARISVSAVSHVVYLSTREENAHLHGCAASGAPRRMGLKA